MKESMTLSYSLAKELSQLFDLEGKIETMLSVSMYYLNQFMDSERSSIFLFQHWDIPFQNHGARQVTNDNSYSIRY